MSNRCLAISKMGSLHVELGITRLEHLHSQSKGVSWSDTQGRLLGRAPFEAAGTSPGSHFFGPSSFSFRDWLRKYSGGTSSLFEETPDDAKGIGGRSPASIARSAGSNVRQVCSHRSKTGNDLAEVGAS